MGISVLWNICNLAVTVLHLWKTRGSHLPVGLIISCISISNMFLELSMTAVLLLFWAGILFSVNYLPFLRATTFIWLQSMCISFWSIAWLSTFYCVKIVSTSSALLCKLKKNISFFITTALLLTVLCSFVACLPSYSQLPSSNATVANETRNATGLNAVLPGWIDTNLYIYVLLGFLCPVPVLVMLPTSLSLVTHLCHHTLAMKKNVNQFPDSDPYLMVCRMTVSMVVVYLTVC
ncbi:LOW QUALITY PROTEIN: taste receptor type 2 member 40 [Conger conger]|uniref:LOW QUALITY PROTEIN: taste receptor type 2 member 40 n=1 Tax=Conger conger TaxID=82655 RepID=UPI002A5AFD06|nr:LOW QUALITY PROTEIN: taste receptor type 2 member 40 [Conger conger]